MATKKKSTKTVKKSSKVTKAVKKTLKKIKQRGAQIKKANKTFSRMSPAEKRVQIAKDVINQLRAKKLVATEGYWVATETSDDDWSDRRGLLLASEADKALDKALKELPQCHTCALGGMFVCAVNRAKKLKVNDLADFESAAYYEDATVELGQDDLVRYLGQFFSQDQLSSIEQAFEGGMGAYGAYGGYGDNDDAAIDFGGNFDNPTDRMIAIMKNIVKNKGAFRPTV